MYVDFAGSKLDLNKTKKELNFNVNFQSWHPFKSRVKPAETNKSKWSFAFLLTDLEYLHFKEVSVPRDQPGGVSLYVWPVWLV